MLSKSGFAHGDLLEEHIQCVGRSLKVNGADCRDAYKRFNRTCRTEIEILDFYLFRTLNERGKSQNTG